MSSRYTWDWPPIPDSDATRQVGTPKSVKTSDLKESVKLYDANGRQIEKAIIPIGFKSKESP